MGTQPCCGALDLIFALCLSNDVNPTAAGVGKTILAYVEFPHRANYTLGPPLSITSSRSSSTIRI